jgi:hypothetical protein
MQIKATELPPVPEAFARVFYTLARRCQATAGKTVDARLCADYWSALDDVPLDELTAGADTLGQARVFFPTVAEWRRAAHRHRPLLRPACAQCGGQGAIRIAYGSGEPFDVALCTCPAGEWCRRVGEAFVRTRLQLGDETRVAPLEDFREDV